MALTKRLRSVARETDTLRRENRPRLVVICGLPCSGKTTHARALESQILALRLCADEWLDELGISLWDAKARARIEALQWSMARRVLGLGLNVIIEWGTWVRAERDRLREGAHEVGAAVELHFLDAPVDELFRRAQNRHMDEPPMSREDLQRWSDSFERPTPEEMAMFDHSLTTK